MKDATLHYSDTLRQAGTPDVDGKKNLISLTKKSLIDEYKIVKIDKDYSYASTSWLPVKAYYLIFNILLTIEYIFKLQKNAFRLGHTACIEEFTRKLKAGEIQFSEPILNQVFDHSILTHVVKSGANLSSRTSPNEMYKMAIRKIARYKLDDWKLKSRINLRKQVDKEKYDRYLQSLNISVFDFIYHMRIRSNYRDFAFIDDVTSDDTAEYFKSYFGFTVHFVKALEGMKKDLLVMRA